MSLSPPSDWQIAPSSEGRRGRILVRPRWGQPDGVRNLLVVATPLIVSHAVHAINMFFDRTFLAWYSSDAFTASLQAGMLHWTVVMLFMGTVMYVATFVAQYSGAEQPHQVGPIVWQSIYVALAGGVILAAAAGMGYPLFRWIGHEGLLPLLEAQYFEIMMLGSVALLVSAALSSYYTGIQRTGLVLFVNAAVCGLNICLNVWMIFQPVWIFPAGIQGAAWATVIAALAGCVVFSIFIVANPATERVHALLSGWRPNRALATRLLRFGLPSGVHHVIDMIGFTTFMLVVGYFGYQAQMASNMAMNLNLVLFIPAIGLHAAVQIMVGNFCGGRDDVSAERITATAAIILFVYMALLSVVYIGFPEPFLSWFRGGTPEAEWREVFSLARILLVFVAIYSLFDAMVLVYSGALKGAGDTKFVMWVSVIFSQVLLTGPCILVALFRDSFATPTQGLMTAWFFCAFYILFLGAVNLLRFRAGRWKHIEVIDRGREPGAGGGGEVVSAEEREPLAAGARA